MQLVIKEKNKMRLNHFIEWLLYLIGDIIVFIVITSFFKSVYIDTRHSYIYSAIIVLIISILNPKTDNANSATTTTTQVETTTELETTEPETTEPEESYDELYYDCLNNIYNKYGQETRYSFYDFNKDGIDELIVSYGESELGWFNEVYAINDGKIYSAGTFPKPSAFYIDENDEGIYAIWTKQGCGLIQHITMEEGSNQITVEDTGSQDFSSYEANEPLENDYAETYLDNY